MRGAPSSSVTSRAPLPQPQRQEHAQYAAADHRNAASQRFRRFFVSHIGASSDARAAATK